MPTSKVYALTSPQMDLRLIGMLEGEGVIVIPLTGEEFSAVMGQYHGDGLYTFAEEVDDDAIGDSARRHV